MAMMGPGRASRAAASGDDGGTGSARDGAGTREVRAAVRGRAVLVTGGTGFVGKALLEKIVRCLPETRRVFVLVRASKGRGAAQRLQREVVESPIFENLERAVGRAEVRARCDRMLVAVDGDITLPGLGIGPEDLARMQRERVEILMHCAASVNFDDPLEQAVQLNTRGAMEALEVARTLRVRAMVHVSTAYVAANVKTGEVMPERVHDLDFDPEEVLRGMTRSQGQDGDALGISRLRLRIQGDFPNTYTLTKAMGETMLQRLHDDIPLAIVRPSIIGAAWREPCPGWVDVVSAATAVFAATVRGVVTVLPGNPRGVAAIVPVDFVVNHMLRACADIWDREGQLRVSHSCTSTFNPCRWRVVSRSVLASYRDRHPPSKLTPGPVTFRMLHSRQQFALEWALRYSLPAWAYAQFGAATGSASASRLGTKLQLLQDRSEQVVALFEPFTTTNYRFDCATVKRWSREDQGGDHADATTETPDALSVQALDLCVDAVQIVWARYIENYTHGMDRFILHDNVVPVSNSAVSHNDVSLTLGRLLKWDPDHHRISFPGIISDISWAYTSSRKPGYTQSGVLGRLMGLTGWREGLAHEAEHVSRRTKRSVDEMRTRVLKAKVVKRAIKQEIRAAQIRNAAPAAPPGTTAHSKLPEVANAPLPRAAVRAKVTARAHDLFTEIASTMIDGPPRWLGWALRKTWRNMYEGIRVHEEGLERLRAVASAAQYPIVLVPTHRSYVDFLMLSFLMFAFNLPVPYIASTTDFLGMKGVSGLLRSSGAFFLRRNGALDQDPLYAAVFTAYMEQLLLDRQIVEYYIEGTRSRSGKILDPKSGLTNICIDPVRRGDLEDLIFVPISIDYEKPVEAALYSHEMLGSSKVPETTENLLKALLRLGNKFGYVSVQFGDHIMARQELQRSTPPPSPARALGLRIIHAMQQAAVCMPIHLVATLLLRYRHGLTLEQLVPSVEWLREEVLRRGGHVACAEREHRVDLVKRAIRLLGSVIQERQSPRVVEVAVDSATKDFHHMVVLGYYRNKIIHLFAAEAFWACALYARCDPLSGLADLDLIQEDASFLDSMLRHEFVCISRSGRDSLTDLQDQGVVEVAQDGKVRLAREQENAERVFGLLCSMVWPFIDSYFVAISGLLALLPDAKVKLATLIQRMLTLAENLYQDRVILHYESCASGTLQNALRTLCDWGVITIDRQDPPRRLGQPRDAEFTVSLVAPFTTRDRLQALITRVNLLRGPQLQQSSASSATVTSSVANFPMLARI